MLDDWLLIGLCLLHLLFVIALPGVSCNLVDGPHPPLALYQYVVAHLVEAFPLQRVVDCLGQPGKRVLVRSDNGLTERLLTVVLELLLQSSLPVAEFGPHGDGYDLLPLVDDEHSVVLTVFEQSHLKAVTNLPLVRLAEVY